MRHFGVLANQFDICAHSGANHFTPCTRKWQRNIISVPCRMSGIVSTEQMAPRNLAAKSLEHLLPVRPIACIFSNSAVQLQVCFNKVELSCCEPVNKMCRTRVCLQWISETAGVMLGPIFLEEMQATKQQALWAKDKESESRSGRVWRCGSCGYRLRLRVL